MTARPPADLDSSTDSEAPAARTFKVTVLGDGAVGKSSVCARFCSDLFAAAYKQTVGLDFFSQTVALEGGGAVTFNLYDIGGQSIGSGMLPTYLRGSDAYLLVYDMTSSESLENVLQWYAVVRSTYPEGRVPDGVLRLLVGNKSDLASLRAVRSARAEEISRKCSCYASVTVSALTGDRVSLMFVSLAGSLTGTDVGAMMLDTRKVDALSLPTAVVDRGADARAVGALVGSGEGVDPALLDRVRRRVQGPREPAAPPPADGRAGAAEQYAADGTEPQMRESIRRRGRCCAM